MPRPVGYGRPGTAVIPNQWAAVHGRVAAGTHTARVKIGPPGGAPVFDEDLGHSVAQVADAAYDGLASIQPETTTSRDTVAAEDVVSIGHYVVSIDRTQAAAVAGDHVVFVVESSDPSLVGRRLSIDGIGHASEQFETDLHCTLVD